MAHDHKADEQKVRDAVTRHKGKGVPQIEARLRAFFDTAAANYRAAADADRPAMLETLFAAKEAAIALVIHGE